MDRSVVITVGGSVGGLFSSHFVEHCAPDSLVVGQNVDAGVHHAAHEDVDRVRNGVNALGKIDPVIGGAPSTNNIAYVAVACVHRNQRNFPGLQITHIQVL